MPQFELKLEHELKYAFFFKGKNESTVEADIGDVDDVINKEKGFLMKNYILVTTDNELIVKNLGVRKKSNSALSRKIFWDYLVPQIIEKGEVKFSRVYMRNLIQELLEKDISLIVMRKEVGDYAQYAKSSPNGIQAQITKKYGPGIHFLVPNNRGIGIGKGKSYCKLEEFKERKLGIDSLDLDNVWKELEYFIKPTIAKNIFEY